MLSSGLEEIVVANGFFYPLFFKPNETAAVCFVDKINILPQWIFYLDHR